MTALGALARALTGLGRLVRRFSPHLRPQDLLLTLSTGAIQVETPLSEL